MKNFYFILLFLATVILTGCGKKTEEKIVVQEKIVTETVTETVTVTENKEVVVEVEKQPTKVSLELFAGEFPLQDDNCDRSYNPDMKDVCLYGVDLEIIDITQLNKDWNKIQYTSELDGNILNVELYQGNYLAEVNAYIYLDSQYIAFQGIFELPVGDTQIEKRIDLIPIVNDFVLKDRYVDNIQLDRILGEGTWELYDLYKDDTIYVGKNFYPKSFVYGGELYLNFNTFNFEETSIDSITIKSSSNAKVNIGHAEVYISANEETEIFTSIKIFGTTRYHIDISEIFTEEDITFEILSIKDSQGNIIPINETYTAKYFEKGEIKNLTSLKNEQRFIALGEAIHNLQVCVESDTQPEYLIINNLQFTENITRSGNRYCFSELDVYITEYSSLIKTDNNAEVVSITATGEISGEVLIWEKSAD